MQQIASRALLVIFCLFTTLGLQFWVGGATIYSPQLSGSRDALHAAILNNRPPAGRTWESVGARNTNTRIAAVYLAEGMHRVSGASVAVCYWIIDTLALWLALVLLFVFLRQWFDAVYSALGLLYLVSILPLTYFLHYFHPWDRLSLALWIVIGLNIKRDRPLAVAFAIAVAMLVKYDVVVAPALYWLAHVSRAQFKRVGVRALLFAVVSFGVLVALLALFRGGSSGSFTEHSLVAQVVKNGRTALSRGLSYPPLLVHVLPVCLAAYGWRRADQVARACFAFGLGILVPIWMIASNFEEVRAELALVVLALPNALYGLHRLLGDRSGACVAGTSEAAETLA